MKLPIEIKCSSCGNDNIAFINIESAICHESAEYQTKIKMTRICKNGCGKSIVELGIKSTPLIEPKFKR